MRLIAIHDPSSTHLGSRPKNAVAKREKFVEKSSLLITATNSRGVALRSAHPINKSLECCDAMLVLRNLISHLLSTDDLILLLIPESCRPHHDKGMAPSKQGLWGGMATKSSFSGHQQVIYTDWATANSPGSGEDALPAPIPSTNS